MSHLSLIIKLVLPHAFVVPPVKPLLDSHRNSAFFSDVSEQQLGTKFAACSRAEDPDT